MPTVPDLMAPYDTSERKPEWQAAVEDWPWDDVGWRKSGSCPRCGHKLVVSPIGGVQALVAVNLTTVTRTKVLARCSCSGEHKNHPDKPERDWGCGFHCLVKLPKT